MTASWVSWGMHSRAAGRGMRLVALRAPLGLKLIGANALVIAILYGAWVMAGGPSNRYVYMILAFTIAIHLTLVGLALRPIRDLELVAERVWQGDMRARVEGSPLADHDVLRVGSMFNILLESLAADRERLRALASDLISARDGERAAIGRELHDSLAQQLAALLYQVGSAARDADDPALAQQLASARDAAEDLLADVRALSDSVHPAVLHDLGLEAALRKLARDASRRTGIDADVEMAHSAQRLPRAVESVLYSVANEAVANSIRHARARIVRIHAASDERFATLSVHDDGRGLETSALGAHGALAALRERLALVDGRLVIKSAKGNGTTIEATVPLDINGAVTPSSSVPEDQ